MMSDPKNSPEAADNKENPGQTEKAPSQEDVQQVDKLASEPEAKVQEETEQPLYGDRNPNWGEKDLPPRRGGS